MNMKSIQFNKGEVAKVEEGKTSDSVCMSYFMVFLLLFNLKKGLVKLKYDSS